MARGFDKHMGRSLHMGCLLFVVWHLAKTFISSEVAARSVDLLSKSDIFRSFQLPSEEPVLDLKSFFVEQVDIGLVKATILLLGLNHVNIVFDLTVARVR